MTQSIVEVRDVIEKNDCAGRKAFYATSMASDETITSIYRLNPAWLPPDMKLALASVSPMDRLRVYHHHHSENLLYNGSFVILDGDFVENLSDTHLRDHLCRCGTKMVSDGFDIHCPNLYCGLTLAARLDRLGNTEFFDVESITSDGELVQMSFTRENDYHEYCHPFMFVTQGAFWGVPTGSVDAILLRLSPLDMPNMATFLIPELFEAWMENPAIPKHIAEPAIFHSQRVYGWLVETTNRRDWYSAAQNRLWAAFLWSLGLESLKPVYFDALFNYEMCQSIMDPAVVYAALLTNPSLLMEAGLHHLEAMAIVNEVKRRSHEIHDIFYCYAINKADITASFRHLM